MEVIYVMLCVVFSCWFYIYGTKQVNEAKFSRWWVASCVIWHSALDMCEILAESLGE